MHRILQLTAVFTLLIVTSAATGAEPPVRVLVYGEHQGGTITYHYTLINKGKEPVVDMTIGSEYDAEHDETFPELGRLPIGWQYGKEGEVGTEIILSPASTRQPSGWGVKVYGQQDIAFYYLNWSSGSSETSVKPGQTLSGFSVTVSKGKDPNLFDMPQEALRAFVNGHFAAGIYPGSDVHGALERQDTKAPSVNLTVTRSELWPPNGRLVPITVGIAVKDDYDPEPEIKLESITANEALDDKDINGAKIGSDSRSFKLAAKRSGDNKEGRIYTITYSATDATGNKATANTTVTVPHDKEK